MNELPIPLLRIVATLPEAAPTARTGTDSEACWGLECALPFLIPALKPGGSGAGWVDTV